jgi:hypothetical protein
VFVKGVRKGEEFVSFDFLFVDGVVGWCCGGL